jgi:hypothetical protein
MGGVLDVKKVGRALPRTGELFSGVGVEKWISGFHYCSPKETENPLFYTQGGALRPKIHCVFRAFPQNFKMPVRQKDYRCGLLLLRGQEQGNYFL